ncbi:MAG: DinB family protein [Gemmataceae bacterium]
MAANLTELVISSFISELEGLRDAVNQVAQPLTQDELWKKPLEQSNSIGHLILHLTGNLNYFVGAQLGKSGYVRDREREFSETNVPSKDTVLKNLCDAVATFRRVVSGLTDEQLAAPFPDDRFGPVLSALLHWVSHFALHRGQMSYIARLVQGSTK